MDEGRKRVIGIMAAILTAMHMRTADDLFGTPQGSPRTDRLIASTVLRFKPKLFRSCGLLQDRRHTRIMAGCDVQSKAALGRAHRFHQCSSRGRRALTRRVQGHSTHMPEGPNI